MKDDHDAVHVRTDAQEKAIRHVDDENEDMDDDDDNEDMDDNDEDMDDGSNEDMDDDDEDMDDDDEDMDDDDEESQRAPPAPVRDDQRYLNDAQEEAFQEMDSVVPE